MFDETVEGGDSLDLSIDEILKTFSDIKLEIAQRQPFLIKQGEKWRVGTPDMHAPVKTLERRRRIEKWLKSDLPSLKEQPLNGIPIAVCCYGPSLLDHIEDLKAYKGTIMTVSGAHDVLLGHGITPDYHVEIDPREHKAEFVKSPCDKTTYLISTACHDAMFENLKNSRVVLWNVLADLDDHDFNIQFRPNDLTVHVGSAVGLGAIILSRVLGHIDIDVFGMDCSARESRHAGPHNGKVQKLLTVECNGRLYKTSAQMVAAARDFFAMCRGLDTRITLHGDGLLQHWISSVIERKANV